jgi:hypothetical protein
MLLAPHRICRLAVACVMLAGLALRTPGKACCGEGVAMGDPVASTSMTEENPGTGCHHCSKPKATVQAPAGTQADASCSTDAARDCGGEGSGKNDPCRGGGCAAVCCHVNALTTVPPAVAVLDAVVLQVAVADQATPALADREGIFHPPRA